MALRLLLSCTNPSALDYAAFLWRETVIRGDAPAKLEEFIRKHPNREHATEQIRTELADGNRKVRQRALVLLQVLGTLQDIGLLMDLLALPAQSDEFPRERELMNETLNVLSGKKKLWECGSFLDDTSQ